MGVIFFLLKMSHFHCSFETISDCQCNGHSSCGLDGRTCIQPCEDHSEGAHCDKCSRGYYGNPVNGGECNACQVWPLTQFYSFSLFFGEEIVIFPFFQQFPHLGLGSLKSFWSWLGAPHRPLTLPSGWRDTKHCQVCRNSHRGWQNNWCKPWLCVC